ncbi:MAG: hypothetical protein KDN22_34165, partial [Verrucomicrobiae bacterium]|nr:hypothetical protein [Verrucomicrobiae bacterium]
AVSGDTVVAGASGEGSSSTDVNGNQSDNGTPSSGAAYVFVRNGTTWGQEAYLKASNSGVDDAFGFSAAISGDVIVVGAFGEDSDATGVNGNQDDNSAPGAGATYVFMRTSNSWTQQAYLKASNTEEGDRFGSSIAVSGETVVVGAAFEEAATGVNGDQNDNSARAAGAAYVFGDVTFPPLPFLSAGNARVLESNGSVQIAITLETATGAPVAVDYSFVNSTAQAGADFTATSGTITIPAGQTTATITVPIINDNIDELDETFTVQLSNPINAPLKTASATITIEDDDVSIVSISDAFASEDAETITFALSLSNPASRAVTIDYATAGGSATEGADYTRNTGTRTFPAGTTALSLAVQLIDDALVEGSEQFTVTLSNASTAIGDGSAVGTIRDDDSATGSEVTLFGWQYPNGAVFRGDLSHQDFLMQDGALLGAYNFGHGTAGATTTVAGIPFANAGTAGNPTGEMAPGVTYTVTGMPNTSDGLGHPGIDDLFFSEVSGTIGTLSVGGLDPEKHYVVQLLFGDPRAVQATNWTVGGDIEGLVGNIGGSGTDYSVSGIGQGPLGNGIAGENPPNIGDRRILTFGVSGRVTFSFKNFGRTGKAASFSGFQIREIEEYPPSPEILTTDQLEGLAWTGDQVVAVGGNGSIFTSPGCINWTAQDSGVTTSLADAVWTGERIVVVASDGVILTSPEGITWTQQESETTERLLDVFQSGTVTVALGFNGTILTSPDGIAWTQRTSSTNQTFIGGTWSGTQLVAVGAAGTIRTSTDGIIWTARSSGTTRNLHLVEWNGSQYVAAGALGTVLTSPDGITWTQRAFPTTPDFTGLVWTGELFVASTHTGEIHTSPDGITWTQREPVSGAGFRELLWTGSLVVGVGQSGAFQSSPDGIVWQIATCPGLAIAGTQAAEGTPGIEFTITLERVSDRNVQVDYATIGGTATPGADYTDTTGRLTIPAGETMGTIFVPILEDNLVEPQESFTVELSNASEAGLQVLVATGTIIDNDTTSISASNASVVETAGSLTIPVTLTKPSANAVTVDFVSVGLSATSGSDYAGTPGTLTFSPGVTSIEISISITDDTVSEGDETFQIVFSNPVGAGLHSESVVITISDDDFATLSIADTNINESAGEIMVAVTLSNPSAFEVSVDYEAIGSSATVGEDFSAVSGTLTFSPGETEKTIPVPITDDSLVEADEQFFISLRNASGAFLAEGGAIVTIADNDVGLSVGDVTINEWGGTATVVVSLSATTTFPVSFDYHTGPGSATANEDFLPRSGTAEIAAGEIETTITIPIIDDTEVEGDETFTVMLDNLAGADSVKALA